MLVVTVWVKSHRLHVLYFNFALFVFCFLVTSPREKTWYIKDFYSENPDIDSDGLYNFTLYR